MARDPAQQPDMSRLLAMAPASPAGAPVSVSTNYPPSPNPFLRSPLPPSQQTSVDQLRQFYRVGNPQYRLLPLQPNAKAAANAAAIGIAETAVAQGGGGNANVTLTMPVEYAVSGSPGNNLGVTWVDEPPNFFLAGPFSAFGFDESQTFNDPGAAVTSIAFSAITPTQGNEFVFIYTTTTAGISFTPAGVTPITGGGFFGLQLTDTTPVTISATINPTSGVQALEILLFSGGAPVFIQNATGALTSGGTLNLPGATTAGNSILAVMSCLGSGTTAPNLLSPTDNQGNPYIQVAGVQQGTPRNRGTQGLMAFDIAGGAYTFKMGNVDPTISSGSVTVFEVSGLTQENGTPRFRRIRNTDFDSGANANSLTFLNGALQWTNPLGSTGVLGTDRGGTGSNLSATGGFGQVVQQGGIGVGFTVSQLAASSLSNGVTGSGAIVLAGSPTVTTPKWSAFTVAGLPAGAEGLYAYATDGRKVGEGPGAGTGTPVYFSNTLWRVFSTDTQVLA